ncbi:MAG: two component transcriptional regulator, AraC family, partial [Sporomusa sp.]|nr:two component transcriptional regulator, AraC family [Sporomusa sp.]
KQQQGINFIDYVTQIRLKEAKRLLSSTTLRISEIAERLGYSDLAYFTNIFKKSCHVTPSEYRKTHSHQ